MIWSSNAPRCERRSPPQSSACWRTSPKDTFTNCSQAGSRLVTRTRNLRPNLVGMDVQVTTGEWHASGVSRVDLHCHSSASEVSRLGVQRAMGLPECATPPEEVYA